MIKTIVLILCVFISFVTHAQEISTAIILQDGEIVDNSHVFLDGETATFHLQDANKYYNIKWSLDIQQNNDKYLTVLESDKDVDEFKFTVSPDLFQYGCKMFKVAGDSSVYFNGAVHLHETGRPIDKYPIRFNLLPSTPKVTEASLNGGYFDFKTLGYDPFATLHISFISAGIEDCWLMKYESTDSVNIFQFPHYNYIVYYHPDVLSTNEYYKELEFSCADWGQFYILASKNKYGMVLGADTINTTELVTDQEILDALSNYRASLSVRDVASNERGFFIKNNVLYIKEDAGLDAKTTIFSSDGRLIYMKDSQKEIDLNFLERGIYIIKIRLNNKKVITQKYIKQ